MTRCQTVIKYLNDGFVKTVRNNSGLSTDVLTKGHVVVRIGDDDAYHHFADGVIKGIFSSVHLVNISKHIAPLGIPHNKNASGYEFTVTEMELLNELILNEEEQYQAWIDQLMKEVNAGITPSADPFGMLSVTLELIHYAKKNGLMLDLIHHKNIMKRGSTWVHIDPFAY